MPRTPLRKFPVGTKVHRKDDAAEWHIEGYIQPTPAMREKCRFWYSLAGGMGFQMAPEDELTVPVVGQ